MSERETYRLRWTTTVDIYVDASGVDEDDAYDQAVKLVEDRLNQVAVPIGDVSIHGSIDGMEPDEIASTTPAETGGGQ